MKNHPLIGVSQYVTMNNAQYANAANLSFEEFSVWLRSHDDRQLVLPPHFFLLNSPPLGCTGKSVAVIGNGLVKGYGREIDSHDIVIRINALYNWQRNELDDGLRCDWWIGRAGMDMVDPARYLDPGHPKPANQFTSICSELHRIISIGHTDVEAGFLNCLRDFDVLDKFECILSAPYVFELFDKEAFFLQDTEFMQIICRRQYHPDSPTWGGFWGWNMLFTGVRAALLLALSRPRHLRLYGFDFYQSSTYAPWKLHELDAAKYVLNKCAEFCAVNNAGFHRVV